MAKKLSELLAETGLTLEELIDDETELSIPEVRKRLKENQGNYTKATQTLAEKDRELQQYSTAYQGWKTRAEQLEAHSQSLEQKIAQRAEKVQEAGGDWKRDPLFQDLVADFDKVTSGISESREASSALANGMMQIATRYTNDRKQFLGWVDKQEQRNMKQDHPDFDADEIKKWANENGVADSWEGSYTRWKASKMPEIIEQTKKATREEVLAEHGDKLRAPIETEMGSSHRSGPPVGGTQKKDYKNAWEGLAKTFEDAGVGRI